MRDIPETRRAHLIWYLRFYYGIYMHLSLNKGNNKFTELRTILQRESQNS